MTKKLIEMVCTGNQGRSPVAELIAQNYLRSIGADEYTTISSGTSVTAIKKGKPDTAFMIHVIDIGKNREIYSKKELNYYQTALIEGDDNMLSVLYVKAQNYFGEEERRYRLEVLPELGIEGVLKEEQEQTIVRPNTIAIFSMAMKNKLAVREIYKGFNHKPIIEVLSAYATGDQDSEIPNAFGLPKEDYIMAVERILEDVPKVINKLLN